jgi:hypothetical protein
MKLGSTFNAIHEAMQGAAVADTHEHLRPVDDLGPMDTVALIRNSYLTRCLRRADGVPNGLGEDLEISLDADSWETVQAVVQRVRFTSYWRWLFKGLRDLYDIPDGELTPTTWEYLSQELARRYADKGWMRSALERANIQLIIWDPNWKPGTTVVPDPCALPSLRINSALVAFNAEETDSEGHNMIREWAPSFDLEVDNLSDLEGLIDRLIDQNVKAGCRSFKSSIAYDRTIAVDQVPRTVADRLFGRPSLRMSPEDKKAFGDYVVHFCMEQARDRGLVVQFHTGMGKLSGSNPLLLEPLLLAYPSVIFDVFHGGYPWIRESAGLAHNHPNVRMNLTWLPQLSTDVTVASIREWLQVVPQADRISWGGDCRTVEESYGSLLGLKYALARAISELVDDDYFDVDTGIDAAMNILYAGGASIYGDPPGGPGGQARGN